ncbi:MAG: xanthine dehydrogenase family protein molybdopterin-binding subunit, partial [Desulfatiglandales bacterium]|nr:xanthine dehydrogenase family protein molybdopterin-binding subunit [Desulfatiglandales bacterium]
MSDDRNQSKWVGKSFPAKEILRYVTGRGEYIGDVRLPNMLHAADLRSPYAHARIKHINADEALKLEGVKGVLLGKEIPGISNSFPAAGVPAELKFYSMAVDKVRYMGEVVATVLAKNRYIAEDALDLINVEYEPLPVVVDQEKALEKGAPILHEELGSNLINHRVLHWGDVDKAFNEAEVVIEDRFVFHSYAGVPVENYGVVAKFDPNEDFLTLWANFVGPFSLYYIMAMALRIPENKIRFIVPRDIGGSFGIKCGIFVDVVRIALAAKKFGCAVKWNQDRREHMVGGGRHSGRVSYVKMAATQDGIIKGIDEKWYEDVGAYMRAPEPACMYRPAGNYVGGYSFRNLRVDANAVAVNKLETSPYRGYGCHLVYFNHERILDMLARKLKIDPVEIRMRNLIEKDQFPYDTPSGSIYDSGDYKACLRKAVEIFEYKEMREMQGKARKEGRYVGIGVAIGVDPSVSNMSYITIAYTPEERTQAGYLPKSGGGETAFVKVDPSGTVTVSMGTCQSGQSHETTIAQVVADEFGVFPDKVTVIDQMDTATHPFCISTGSYSSRFASVATSAAVLAARKVKDKMIEIAAYILEAQPKDIEVADGNFFVKGSPNASLSLKRVAGTAHWNPGSLPSGMDVGLSAQETFNFEESDVIDEDDRVNSSNTYGFMADIAAVEVDPDTGKVEILKYATVHDVGTVLNPKFIEGQIYGAITQSVGGVFYEDYTYDENGQMVAGSLADYLCPTALEAPRKLDIDHVVTPS